MDNLEMKKLDGLSVDVVAENKKKLMELFPEVFTEEGIILDKLKTVFGEYVEDKDDYYNFTWNGKDKALRLSQAQSTGTLRPCKEESKNWDTTQNLYIEGDNLEVLMLLRKSYHGKIKMIYIDPPYNTGKDFVYKDNYQDNLKNYLELTKQVDSEGNKWNTNSDQSGRYHTDWLNMMYPRLRVARELLKDDGVIFISIDDNEIANLRKLCEEVFGEENFVATISWQRAYAPVNMNKYFSPNHDYALVFAKNISRFDLTKLPRNEKQLKDYQNIDNDPRGPWKAGNPSVGPAVEKNIYEITLPSGRKVLPPKGRSWLYSEERFKELVGDNRIYFGKNGDSIWAPKMFLSEVSKGITPLTLWTYSEVGHSQDATKELKALFDNNSVFDYSKPLKYLQRMTHIGTKHNSDDIILDFFSGSAASAHSTMLLNTEDNGSRRFIHVQIPEQVSKTSDAYKLHLHNICDIGKERIRRAGEKIIKDNKDKEGIENLDVGFKVFKLDSSNIKKWDANNQNLEEYLSYMVNNFVEGRTEEDVLYEIMLKYGIDLTAPIESRTIAGKNVYSIGFGALFVCLDMEISLDVIDGIVEYKNELEPARTSIIFKDNGFKDSNVKTNALQRLRTNDIEEVMSI